MLLVDFRPVTRISHHGGIEPHRHGGEILPGHALGAVRQIGAVGHNLRVKRFFHLCLGPAAGLERGGNQLVEVALTHPVDAIPLVKNDEIFVLRRGGGQSGRLLQRPRDSAEVIEKAFVIKVPILPVRQLVGVAFPVIREGLIFLIPRLCTVDAPSRLLEPVLQCLQEAGVGILPARQGLHSDGGVVRHHIDLVCVSPSVKHRARLINVEVVIVAVGLHPQEPVHGDFQALCGILHYLLGARRGHRNRKAQAQRQGQGQGEQSFFHLWLLLNLFRAKADRL